MATRIYHSPFGPLLLSGDDRGLNLCRWLANAEDAVADLTPSPILTVAARQLDSYFAGRLRCFSLPLQLRGTPFQLSVWHELANVPYGTTLSYSALARRIGRPTACRAVAAACHANPIAIIIPCHRIIAANGTLHGYAAGLPLKHHLLSLESPSIRFD